MYYIFFQMYFNLDQKDVVVEFVRKVVIVSEWMFGIDLVEMVLNYFNLSFFFYQCGDSKIVFVYVRYVFDVWKLIYGLDYLDIIMMINNYVVMLQSIRVYIEFCWWFEEFFWVCDQVFGRNLINFVIFFF